MGRISGNFGVLYLGVAAAVILKPEYTIYNSRIVSMVILSVFLTISKLIYQLFLYPALFTPLKHIQTPPVSQPRSLFFLIAELTSPDTPLAYWKYYFVFPRDSV
jgi:hypothetical protein